MQIISAEDLLQMQFSQEKYLVEGLLPAAAIVLLSGDSGAGKSYLLLHLGIALSTGQPFLGRPVERIAGKILYVNGDMSKREAQEYLSATISGMELSTSERKDVEEHLCFLADGFATLDDGPNGFNLDPLREVLEAHPDVEVIVIDTFRSVFSMDEKDQERVSALFRELKKLGPSQNVGVIVAHHINKQGLHYRTRRERVSGTTALISDVSCHITLNKVQSGKLEIELDKSRTSATGTTWTGNLIVSGTGMAKKARFAEIRLAAAPTKADSDDGKIRKLATLQGPRAFFTADEARTVGIGLSVLRRLVDSGKLYSRQGHSKPKGGRPAAQYSTVPFGDSINTLAA
jgi:archaellum biogenesis ATPase FlaH